MLVLWRGLDRVEILSINRGMGGVGQRTPIQGNWSERSSIVRLSFPPELVLSLMSV